MGTCANCGSQDGGRWWDEAGVEEFWCWDCIDVSTGMVHL